ncbi:MAG TPA: hypothetical protein VH351_18565 [Bryobacteraceae bacterium]|jgi:hypothetical protein|nr:hypothetical protein [Bryobacteraceae bacterium]
MRIAFFCSLPLALAAAALTLAQTERPSGRQMIDKTIAALGGNRFSQMQTRVSTGRIYGFFHDQISGREIVKSYVRYMPASSPTGLAIEERQLLGKKQDYSNLFTPTAAWDITFRGARAFSDEDWQRYVRTTRNDILYILRCRMNEPGMQFEYIGSDVYVSRHVELVDIIDSTNQVVRVYLDHNTMLPMHESYTWFDEKTREHNDAAVDYDKYRDSGGVMWPFVMERARNGFKVFQMFADSVQVDQPSPEGIFNLPSGTPVLKPAE